MTEPGDDKATGEAGTMLERLMLRAQNPSTRRVGLGVAGAAGIAAAVFMLVTPSGTVATADNAVIRDGGIDLVVSRLAYALGPDAETTGGCPAGMTRNVEEIWASMPGGTQRAGESEEAYGARREAGGRQLSTAPDGRNYCEHPEIAPLDTHTRMLTAGNVPALGIDLDDRDSRAASDGLRRDFVSPRGARGIDNQFYRAVGCNRSYQSTGQSNGFETSMHTGAWGVLIRLAGVSDLRNDDSVTVTIAANADPIQLSPARVPLDFATYSMMQDPTFRATTSARLVDGVLTSQPVDVRIQSDVNGMIMTRELRDARIVATLSERGILAGYLAGYTPVTAMYDTQFGYRQGRDEHGQLSPRRSPSANGAARVLGHTCQGIFQSMQRLADGHRDPATGRYTSISTQYHFLAIPAFIVDAPTRSMNASETDAS
jgi:hypothetical protein